MMVMRYSWYNLPASVVLLHGAAASSSPVISIIPYTLQKVQSDYVDPFLFLLIVQHPTSNESFTNLSPEYTSNYDCF